MREANSIDLSGASSVSYSGEELGIGSFDSLNIENVSLKAEGRLSLRSLDSVVLKNAEMITSGKGADFIHVLAANQITKKKRHEEFNDRYSSYFSNKCNVESRQRNWSKHKRVFHQSS